MRTTGHPYPSTLAPDHSRGEAQGVDAPSMPVASEKASEGARHPNIWIIVPAYNEGPRVGGTLRDLLREYRNIVVVDDGSTDDTSGVAREHPVWIVRHAVNCGQGAALQTGIDFAIRQGADILVSFDADGQHRADDIAGLIEPIVAGRADVSLGSRFLGRNVGMPWGRWLLLKLAVSFTRLTSRLRVTDTHNGLRALSRSAAERLRIEQPRMAHASEILARIDGCRLRYTEAPVTVIYSRESLRKGQTVWDALTIIAHLLARRLAR
jgi:polyprenyl-phospho-N-acetylgalactosaminyl synthase